MFYIVDCVVAVAVGLAVGFRPEGGVLDVLAVICSPWFCHLLFLGVRGLRARSKVSDRGVERLPGDLLSVSIVSISFVSQETRPAWLQAMVNLPNPCRAKPFALTITAANSPATTNATVPPSKP
ncbi:hypothetical protein [Salinispora arenicola]|uniref:hypothetical protein n=1 Tax=Salinispora arenicola TaxID=168697 RepID=UPI00039E14AF|nr:hypothetical protein [Salinispora arenicola]